MIFGIADNGNSDAEARGCSALGNSFRGVVGSFGVNVRAKVFEQRLNARFAEEDDVVDGPESRNKEGSGIFVEDRAAGAFQYANARVRIDGHD